MAASFAEYVIIRRSSGTVVAPGGSQDLGDGTWEDSDANPENDSTIVCETKADVQDKPVILRRNVDGSPIETADARIFFYREVFIPLVQPGDIAEVTWTDRSVQLFTVVQVSRLDGALYVARGG